MSYGSEGLDILEGPNYFSKGYYKVAATKSARQACPISISGASVPYDSDDFNKVTVELYTDATHVKPALGISLRNLDPVAALGDGMRYAGTSPYTRDLTVLHMGPYSMIFVSGTKRSKTMAGMDIAPDASGFVDWQPGMFRLGKVIEPGCGTGMLCKVFVDTLRVPDEVFFSEHITSPGGNTGTLTYRPLRVISMDVDTGGTSSGSFNVSYLVTPTVARQCLVNKSTKLVSFLSTDKVSGFQVEYMVDVHEMTGV